MWSIQYWKNWKKEEQLNIDEYNSLNSQNVLNCVRAYICPELICDYKEESDRRLLETNPINIVFKLYISKNKLKLFYDDKIPTVPIQYSKETSIL